MITSIRDGHDLAPAFEAAIESFDIPAELHALAVARYDELTTHVSRYWNNGPAAGTLYVQGSFRLGTVVQPVSTGGSYDIDLVALRDLAKEEISQAALKQDAELALRSYLEIGASGAPRLGEGKRCWTLDYPAEPFHMDILPAIPDPGISLDAVLITDTEVREWQHSNPIGFANWFYTRMAIEREELRKFIAVANSIEVEAVPDWSVKTTLQRTVQGLKRHRDRYFVDEPDRTPASIIITTLAAHAYEGKAPLSDVLASVADRMGSMIGKREGRWWIPNPVEPHENFADRWNDHPQRATDFFDWLSAAAADFKKLQEPVGLDRFLCGMEQMWGRSSLEAAEEAIGGGLTASNRVAQLGAASVSGILSRDVRPSRPQTFYGDYD